MTSAFFGLNSANAENRHDSIPEGIETVISDSELGSLEAISAVNARMEAADRVRSSRGSTPVSAKAASFPPRRL